MKCCKMNEQCSEVALLPASEWTDHNILTRRYEMNVGARTCGELEHTFLIMCIMGYTSVPAALRERSKGRRSGGASESVMAASSFVVIQKFMRERIASRYERGDIARVIIVSVRKKADGEGQVGECGREERVEIVPLRHGASMRSCWR